MESTEMKSLPEETSFSNSHMKNEPVFDFVMDSESKTLMQINDQELETKIDIKEETWDLDIGKMKSEAEKSLASNSNEKKKLVSTSSGSLMVPKNSMAICKDENKVKTEILIKKENLCLENTPSKMKLLSEPPVSNAHFISASIDPIRECKNSTDINEMSMKMEIKEEPWWLDASTEVTRTVDMQYNKKSTTSNIDSTSQDMSPTKTSRLYTEAQCNYGSDISTFPTIAALESRCCQEDNVDNENSSMFMFDRNHTTEECHMENHVKMHDFERLQKHRILPNGDISIFHLKSNNLVHVSKSLDISNTFMNKMTELSPIKNYNVIMLNSKKQYLCKICEKSFSCSLSLRKHNLIHEGKRVQCKICGKDFSQKTYLKTHHLIHEGKKPHNCKICKKSYALASYLKLHNVIHEGKRQHKCKICEKSFIRSSDFRKHSLIHEGKKHHKCKICEKSFTLPSHLKKHILIHGERPHKCNICEKRFALVSSLKIHNFIHDGESPHKCIVGDKSFSTASYLRKHVSTHEGSVPHKCELCKKTFVTASYLRKHNLSHEGKRPHKCDICEKSFIQASHLKTHSLIHSGERPHKCKVCEKNFTTASNLRKHILVHNGIKRHSCTICGKKFLRASDLKKHNKVHVNQRPD